MTSRRHGSTLLEALCVVAIIMLMVGLLLPAIQNVRKHAARLDAADRLRQIMMTTIQFSSDRSGRLPTLDGLSNTSPNRGMSLLDAIRQMLGETSMSRRVANGEWHSYVKYYISPLDPSFSMHSGLDGDCSVAANASVFDRPNNVVNIYDGLSSTIGYSERYARCKNTGFIWSLNSVGCTAEINGVNKQIPCTDPDITRPSLADYPMRDDVAPVRPGGRTTPPDRIFQVAPLVKDCDYRVPQAAHPSGLLTAMLDGSVRWVNPGVAPTMFWAAVTPDGGEVYTLD